MSPQTSIVIRAFNEESYLPGLLEGIESQNYRDWEVILVDSGSYDRTVPIAQAAGAKIIEIDNRDFTFGYSLNVGIRNATGKYVVLVSAHTKPVDNRWLERLVQPLEDPNVALVYGRQVGTSDSKFGEFEDFKRYYGTQRLVLRPPHFYANNANSALRKELWQQFPFDEKLPGLEDKAWVKYWMERDHRVVYEPEAAIYHIHHETWRQVYRRYYREAFAGRAIGYQKRRDIFKELGWEGMRFMKDLRIASQKKCLKKKFFEIVRFRFYKSLATGAGLLNGKALGAVQDRDSLFYDRTCKAVRVNGPSRASLERVPMPEIKPSEILIEVAHEGICATDLEVFSGSLGYYRTGLAKYPITPGHEFSGWVARVGAKVNNFKRGDPVVVECIQGCGGCSACTQGNMIGCVKRKEVGVIRKDGGYSQYVVAPSPFVHKVPAELDLRKAALCEPTAVVLKGLRRIAWALQNSNKKIRCAIVGAGPIGHLSAQVLNLRGLETVVFDRNERRLAHFKGTRIGTGVGLEQLREFDVVIEATGDPDCLREMLQYSKSGATILLLGLPYSRQDFDFESLVAYDKAIVGSVGSTGEDFEEALKILPLLPLDAFFQLELPLEQFEEAWKRFKTGEFLKIFLKVNS